jgi:hypothetical protein
MHPYVRPKGSYEARCRPGEYNDIPYRCLIPLKIENLLVAGRCISADAMAQSGTRLILTCMNMGQAAGTAAALCVKNGVTPRKLDVQLLRRTLIEQGVPLDREPPAAKIPKDAKFIVGPSDHAEVVSARLLAPAAPEVISKVEKPSEEIPEPLIGRMTEEWTLPKKD